MACSSNYNFLKKKSCPNRTRTYTKNHWLPEPKSGALPFMLLDNIVVPENFEISTSDM